MLQSTFSTVYPLNFAPRTFNVTLFLEDVLLHFVEKSDGARLCNVYWCLDNIFRCFENSWGQNTKGSHVLLCHFIAIISDNNIFGIGNSTFAFTHRERKPAVSLTCASCLSAEWSGQLDFDSALWVLGACVCNYFPRLILFKVFPSLPHQFWAAQNLQPWGGRDLEAQRRDWSQHCTFFFSPPGRFLKRRFRRRGWTCMWTDYRHLCACQREKLIKEKKLVVHVGQRVIETACDLPHIGGSLVGLGFSWSMLLLCEALYGAASSVTKIMCSFFLIMGAEKDEIIKHYVN